MRKAYTKEELLMKSLEELNEILNSEIHQGNMPDANFLSAMNNKLHSSHILVKLI